MSSQFEDSLKTDFAPWVPQSFITASVSCRNLCATKDRQTDRRNRTEPVCPKSSAKRSIV